MSVGCGNFQHLPQIVAKLIVKRLELPPADYLRDVFDYDPETGILIRKRTNSRRPVVGKRAGYLHSSGYRFIKLDSTSYHEHRIIYALHHGELSPDHEVDHINGNPADNRIANLRLTDRVGNCQNQKVQHNNTSGCRGIHYDKRTGGKWRVRISYHGKRILIGDYRSLDDAIAARKQAEVDYNYLTR